MSIRFLGSVVHTMRLRQTGLKSVYRKRKLKCMRKSNACIRLYQLQEVKPKSSEGASEEGLMGPWAQGVNRRLMRVRSVHNQPQSCHLGAGKMEAGDEMTRGHVRGLCGAREMLRGNSSSREELFEFLFIFGNRSQGDVRSRGPCMSAPLMPELAGRVFPARVS